MTETPTIRAVTPVLTIEFVTYTPQPFLGYHHDTGRLIHIIGLTTNGNWLSDTQHIYPPDSITDDLTQFAHHKQLQAKDKAETQQDALV